MIKVHCDIRLILLLTVKVNVRLNLHVHIQFQVKVSLRPMLGLVSRFTSMLIFNFRFKFKSRCISRLRLSIR